MSDATMPFGGRRAEVPVLVPARPDSSPVRTSALADGAYVRGAELQIEYTMMHGAGGTTYKARELASGRVLALKVLEGKYEHKRENAIRLLAEAKYTAMLPGHRHIAAVVDHGALTEADGRPYVATEFVDGTTLASYTERVVPLAMKVRLLQQLAGVLADLHAVGVVHRDVKLDNVLVTNDLLVKLTDFGYATMEAGEVPVEKDLTADHERPGTKHYMAPEQCLGFAVTPAFDVYALGVTAYAMFAGAPPMANASERDVVMRKCDRDAPAFSLAALRLEIPRDLGLLVDRMLMAHPFMRPTAAQVRDGLARVLLELEGAAGDVVVGDDGHAQAVARTNTEIVPRGFVPKPPAVVLAPEAIVRTGDTVVVETADVPEPIAAPVKVSAVAARVGTSPVMLPAPEVSAELPRAELLAKLAEIEGGGDVEGSAHGEPNAAPRRWTWIVLAVGVAAAIVVWVAWPHERARDGAGGIDAKEDAPAAKASREPAPSVAPAAVQPSSAEAPTVAPKPAAETGVPAEPVGEGPATAVPGDVPAAAPTREPSPSKPKVPRAPGKQPMHETPACVQLRADATQARDQQAWTRLLALTTRRDCWANGGERRAERIEAYAELGRFADCAAEAAKGSTPASVRPVIEMCKENAAP